MSIQTITSKDKFPTRPHNAAIVFKTHSIYHEGDERSRTNPGHGYPAHTETIHVIEYIPFSTDEEMNKWIIAAETDKYNKINYKLIYAQPLEAVLNTTVSVSQ